MESEEQRVATFAGGCFWCTEAVFQRVKGVLKVQSGFSGGHVKNPSYREVCTMDTGHAECLQIFFDPNIVTYDDLLQIFWKTHDPTTLNRQGNDIGTQYRSIIFYHNEEQKQKAIASRDLLEFEHIYENPIVTEIIPFKEFFPAEEIHRNYYNDHTTQPYCQVVVKQKVNKLEKYFSEMVKD